MDLSELKKPNVSKELAAELAFRLFGLRVTSIKRMVSYDDQNFHIEVSEDFQNPCITSTSMEGYTLKVMNTVKSALPGHFDSMHGAMIHLHNRGLTVPVPIPNIEGTTWKLEKVPLLNEGDADQPCGVHMLTYIPGQPISTVTLTKDILFQWGSLLAKFHNAIEDLISPHLKNKDIFWNLGHVCEIRKFMEGLDRDKQNLVNSVLEQYPNLIVKNLPHLPKGFIHGDFNENNILVQKCPEYVADHTREYNVIGILDFDDTHYATYVWDIGVMLAYTLLDCITMDPLEGAGHALAGYLTLRSLNELELSLLKMCSACRLCQSLVMGAYSYSLDPSNSYLIGSARTGWCRLKQLWNTSDEELLKKWNEICNQYKAGEN